MPRPPLARLFSVSQDFTLLVGLQAFLCGSGSKPDSERLASRLDMIPSIFLNVCPFGTPLDIPQLGASLTSAMPSPAGTQKQPAWKTGLHCGGAVVNVALMEMVRSMQYGNQNRQDLWKVYSTVNCKGSFPILSGSAVTRGRYTGPCATHPPYQLKEDDNQLHLTVSLKLHESRRNSFEYCEAHLPFFNSTGAVILRILHLELNWHCTSVLWTRCCRMELYSIDQHQRNYCFIHIWDRPNMMNLHSTRLLQDNRHWTTGFW
ncbi:hypothetical protein J4Q44_G00224070 [Coregonus suidteri]|uniref:Uncharacterized protein n=1 Tax=Coregonus suidteri TaxID=861788 RepID=A0AAN8LDK8_9TELE